MTDAPNRIRELRNVAGLSQATLAQKVGTSNQQIGRLEKGTRGLTTQWMDRIAAALECSPADLLPRVSLGPSQIEHAKEPRLPQTGLRLIPEIDVRAGMGGGGEAAVTYVPDGNGGMMAADDVRDHWSLPEGYLRSELHVGADVARIIEVQGDSMEPSLRSGDRIMVNVVARTPSPPGLFALWDGFGLVVKRIEHIPNSDPPALKVLSDNPLHADYERTAEEVNIVGRVIWYARRV